MREVAFLRRRLRGRSTRAPGPRQTAIKPAVIDWRSGNLRAIEVWLLEIGWSGRGIIIMSHALTLLSLASASLGDERASRGRRGNRICSSFPEKRPWPIRDR